MSIIPARQKAYGEDCGPRQKAQEPVLKTHKEKRTGSGSSGAVPAWQIQHPEFKPQYC
jgi:hypothetical protein